MKKKSAAAEVEYDLQWPRAAAEKMHMFAADMEVLKPFVKNPLYAKAYKLAEEGFEMAVQDYIRALPKKGMMNR